MMQFDRVMLGKTAKERQSGLDCAFIHGQLSNPRSLLCKDATNTELRSASFDTIIIGLVLHECNEDLWKGILNEAHRLLKENGKLIILE